MYDEPYYLPTAPADSPDASPKDGLTQLKGSVEHIIYANEDIG